MVSIIGILFNGACTTMGMFYAMFALFNLVGDSGALGSFGAKFIFEMDRVMGALIGIPKYYSKVEAVILFGASFCLFSSLFHEMVHVCMGLVVVTGYMVTCSVYAYCVHLPVTIFAGMGFFSGILLIPGLQRIPSREAEAGKIMIWQVAFVTAAFVLVTSLAMLARAPARAGFHKRYRQIVEYCDAHPDFVWINGKDAPEGFESKDK
jgi:hypothetical protein